MAILISLTVLLVFCIYMYRTKGFRSNWDSGVMIVSMSLFIALVLLPITYYGSKSEVAKHYAFKQTIEKSRESNISDIERATLTNEIVEHNKNLASLKFWNDTIFDLWIYDGVADLEYLE